MSNASIKMASVVGYGERGLVNALVRHLEANPSRIGDFISVCHWRGLDFKATFGAMLSDVDRAVFYVEPGFADFGNPDLVLQLYIAERPVFTFFIEAKVVPYLASAKPNSKGMAEPGFNSSINGQLALRYRLVRALHGYQTGCRRLREPEEVFDAAKDRVNDHHGPRALAKSENLRHLVESLRPPNGPSDFMEGTFILALTTDVTDPFDDLDPKGEANERDLLPYYFNQDTCPIPYESRMEPVMWMRTGWTSWHHVEQMGLLADPEYTRTRSVALDNRSCHKLARHRTDSPAVKLENWTAFSPSSDMKRRAATLCAVLREMAERRFGSYAVEEIHYEGSLTLRVGGLVVVKVVPQRAKGAEHLEVGLADDQDANVPAPFPLPAKSIRGRTFRFLAVDETCWLNPDSDFIRAVDEYFTNLYDALSAAR